MPQKTAENGFEIYKVCQATRAIFTEFYFKNILLFFIQSGEKHVRMSQRDLLVGHQGDLMIFASGSMVTLENRPIINDNYRAIESDAPLTSPKYSTFNYPHLERVGILYVTRAAY